MALTMCACSSPDGPEQNKPGLLRISVLPDQSPEQLQKIYKPLFDYISAQTGLKYQLIIPKSYQASIDSLKNKQTDFAYLGGYTFMLSHIKGLSQPLVMRDVDLKFTSSLITSSKSTVAKLTDLHQKKFAFGSRLSTSGHLMPRYFLQEKGFIPENFFSTIQYSGAHDKTAYLVRDGKADAGILNTHVLKQMLNDGRLSKQDIKVIWTSPAYPDYVWAISSEVSSTTATTLKKAMLQLVYSNPEHKKILDNLSAKAFLPASLEDFDILHTIVSKKNIYQD